VIEQVIDHRPEDVAIPLGEETGVDQVDHFTQVRVRFVVGAGSVTQAPDFLDLGGSHSEQEEVLVADLLANFDVGAVERADGQRAVHLELHVARPRGLLAGKRDLFGQVGSRKDEVRVLDVVVRHEDDLQLAAHGWIATNHIGNGGDQPDHQLGHEVTRRRLAAEDHRARRHLEVRIVLQAFVQRHDVQQVQVLPLVLMDAFDLNVEHRRRIGIHEGHAFDLADEPVLVPCLDFAPGLTEGRIVGKRFEFAQARHVLRPAAANRFVDEGRHRRIRQEHEAARCHAVGLVGELFRPHLVEVPQDIRLQQLGVQCRHAIDGEAAGDCQMCHAHIAWPILVDQRHPPKPGIIARKMNSHIVEETLVDLADDLEMPRQHALEQRQPPFLERLGQ